MTPSSGFYASLVAGLIVGMGIAFGSAMAQDAPAKRHHRIAAAHRREATALPQPLTERRLTIQRRRQGDVPDVDDQDIYLDGDVRYNSVRTFDPVPYADSGLQFPFGLDGIGGYGSDIGFGAGHDSSLYDRGP